MARSWHYPRWRRVLMQVTLWVIFGGTVAAAAWVVRLHRPAAERGEWGLALTAGDLRVRLPAGWDAMPGDASDVLLQATERVPETDADDGPTGRTLIVQEFDAPPGKTAEQFLVAGGPLKNAMIVDGRTELSPTDDAIPSKAVTIGTTPGVMLETIRAVAPAPGQPAMRVHEWIACAIQPDGKAAVLRLQRFDGEPGGADVEPDDVLLSRIAGEMRYRNGGNKKR